LTQHYFIAVRQLVERGLAALVVLLEAALKVDRDITLFLLSVPSIFSSQLLNIRKEYSIVLAELDQIVSQMPARQIHLYDRMGKGITLVDRHCGRHCVAGVYHDSRGLAGSV
jgi:hypothetical protein